MAMTMKMNRTNDKTCDIDSEFYQIRLQGHLDVQWADWFEGLTVTLAANGETLLTGPLVDQAALYGLLKKVRDLGMPLLAVNRINPGQLDRPDAH